MMKIVFLDRGTIGPSVELSRPSFPHEWKEHGASKHEQVVERLEQAQIANAHVNDMRGLWQHPQLAARDRWREIDSPAGRLPALLPPVNSNAYAPRMDAVPALGEQTDDLQRELGYTPGDIQRLHEQGAV